jgi:hypothetical protein
MTNFTVEQKIAMTESLVEALYDAYMFQVQKLQDLYDEAARLDDLVYFCQHGKYPEQSINYNDIWDIIEDTAYPDNMYIQD